MKNKKVNGIGSQHMSSNYMFAYTGGSHLSRIFWEHENQSSLLVIWLIYNKLYRKKETKFWKKIWAKWESGLTVVQLKQDPPVWGSLRYMFVWTLKV